MKVSVKHLDNAGFTVEARGHRVVCDQPTDNRGDDRGMTPPEFLLASLGACAAFYAAEYLRTRGLPLEGLSVEVEVGKAKGPSRLDGFQIRVQTAELDERHQQGVERAVKSCLIHNTLLHAPQIEIAINATVAA